MAYLSIAFWSGGEHGTVHPNPFAAESQESGVRASVPLLSALGEGGVIEVALLLAQFLAKPIHRREYLAIGNLETGQDILTRHQYKSAVQEHVVAIETVPLRLLVRREVAILDAVQTAEAATQTSLEVLIMHAVQHIDPRLPIPGGRNRYEVAAQPVLGVAHQHAVVTGFRDDTR